MLWEEWKTIKKGDYLYAKIEKHPNATKNGYVLEHRAVMENIVGRLLTSEEEVHHIDRDSHNNSPDNLQLLSKEEHRKLHGKESLQKIVVLVCPNCFVSFEKSHRQTFLGKKKGRYTCCSRSCMGKFSRDVALNGELPRHTKAIESNVIKIYLGKL